MFIKFGGDSEEEKKEDPQAREKKGTHLMQGIYGHMVM